MNRWFVAWIGLAGSALLAGCSGALITNLVEESQANVTVQVINNTPFRAIFTIGAFDDLDRMPPGDVTFQQLRLEAGTSNNPITFGCFRDVAIGTQQLLNRIVDTGNNTVANFDDEAFVLGVSFSSAPLDSAGEAQPDAGAADPFVVRLGNDYSCSDQLIFTLEDNGDGTYRIDFDVIQDREIDG